MFFVIGVRLGGVFGFVVLGLSAVGGVVGNVASAVGSRVMVCGSWWLV